MGQINFILRSLAKSKLVNSINILSLSAGLCAVMMISIYVINEIDYDKFHKDGDSIYRVAIKNFRKNVLEYESYTYTPPLAKTMHSDLPGIDSYARISVTHSGYFYLQNKPHKIEDYIYADSTFFKFFSFDLLSGHPDEVLSAPFSTVLTKSLSTRLFGKKDPIGEVILLNNTTPYTITGVAKDPPANSHIQFGMLISFSTRYKEKGNYMGWNGGNQYTHYIKISNNNQLTSLEEKFDPFLWKYLNAEYASMNVKDEIVLQPLEKIHLRHNDYSSSLRRNLLVFSGIGFLLLTIALINFINLTIADSKRRIKNYSLLKILGATRFVLIRNLFAELAFLLFFSLVLALLFISFSYPLFETLIGKSIDIHSVLSWTNISAGILTLLFLGGLTCFLPVMYFADLHPVQSLKKEVIPGKSRFGMKNGLVIFQFLISITLIISLLTINQQNRYIQSFDTGYAKENIMVIPLTTLNLQRKAKLIKGELLGLSSVEIISRTSQVPNDGFTSNGYFLEEAESLEIINVVDVDEDFLDLMNIELLTGKKFEATTRSDDDQYLINEAFLNIYDWENPIGRLINRDGQHQVMGVVKDFNFASLHSAVKPLILTNKPLSDRFEYMMIKLAPGPINQAISRIEAEWKKVSMHEPFEFTFLDESFDQVYQSEASFQKLISAATLLTILISLAGLFALSLFSIQSKIKEIGIRKVSGAKEVEILALLNKKFAKWVFIAFIIACPLAYYLMSRWLENFAYRTPIDWKNFVLGGILALFIALITVSWQSWRAATRNPMDALRTE